MMQLKEITGRILTINKVSDKSSQVVLKKQVSGKAIPIAIEVFGFWKDKMEAMKLRNNDKITGMMYVKSNLYKGRYYTDVCFKEITKWEEKPKKGNSNQSQNSNLFEIDIPENYIIDEETGEIIL